MTQFHVWSGPHSDYSRPAVRRIGVADVFDALKAGARDFNEKPSHYVFLAMIYPVVGILLMAWAAGAELLPLLFPLASGFALIGPFAAIGLYEISRRRERGLGTQGRDIWALRHSPALPSMLALGVMLAIVFVLWMVTAQGIYTAHFGEAPPTSVGAFMGDLLSTEAGWSMVFQGMLAGFCFAVVVLACTVIAFPMMLERDCGAACAIETSVRATMANPGPIALWGLIVAAMLTIGFIPLMVGLIVTMPILGHATWHLYRKLVARPAR
ncbi:DUF2189 domain-containing protein [Rhizobium sp. RU36D]|uniref:DUF2189 domain-containing protein n=1 Tax=Rhizobium sp. RU36D TaxID=1907415 RepID=UPI0009D8536C|nr:DUF2189 domain-containing protein [Rhizobium sp. RU36D]SMC81636.1 Uncharacterized membrane protein [Rhizobium sp. RU36D]